MRVPCRKAALAPLAPALVALLFAAAPARADVGEKIILKCTHGESLAGYSPKDYSRALEELSADTEEYTDCASLIRAAQLAAAGGHPAESGPVAPIAATPFEQSAIAHARRSSPSAPVKVGSQLIHPGVVHVNLASALSALPTPVLAMLAFLLACLAAVLGVTARNRIRARRAQH